MENYIEINCDHLDRPCTDLDYKSARKDLNKCEKFVTIVVQAYGRLEKLKICVECILKYTDEKYEIVLLDNGTEDDSVVSYFESIERKNKKVVKFSKNITGVYCLNTMFHMIKSKYVVWVNSDVYVTSNWLDNLLICAESDSSIGVVVPTSTNISLFQLETLGGFNDFEEMQNKAKEFNISDPLKWEEIIRLIPSATLYRREIFDTVGVYDIGFMHDFGDDDYTFRVRRAGYKLMLCRDTFVHHDHDQTNLPQERIEIMNNSRAFFADKYHGIDAWNDTDNYISFMFDNLDIKDFSPKSIMAIDVKCGVPLLNTKNFLRKNNVQTYKSKCYTSDAKYFIDLQSISDEVVFGDVEGLIIDEKGKFDYVVIGNPINCYSDPYKFLENIIACMKKNGILIFYVRNTNDIRSFLDSFNIYIPNDPLQPKAIKYTDFISYIENKGLVGINLRISNINIPNELSESISLLVRSLNCQNGDSILQRIMTENYWIAASRMEK